MATKSKWPVRATWGMAAALTTWGGSVIYYVLSEVDWPWGLFLGILALCGFIPVALVIAFLFFVSMRTIAGIIDRRVPVADL